MVWTFTFVVKGTVGPLEVPWDQTWNEEELESLSWLGRFGVGKCKHTNEVIWLVEDWILLIQKTYIKLWSGSKNFSIFFSIGLTPDHFFHLLPRNDDMTFYWKKQFFKLSLNLDFNFEILEIKSCIICLSQIQCSFRSNW